MKIKLAPSGNRGWAQGLRCPAWCLLPLGCGGVSIQVMLQRLIDAAYARESEYLALLTHLVNFESPSAEKIYVDKLVDFLQTTLMARGWALERRKRDYVGDILIARKPGLGGVSTLMLAHCDTVWPLGTLAAMPLRREGDRFMGPGVIDMKSGIVNAIEALYLLEEAGIPPAGDVTLMITTDEELSSAYSQGLIEELARQHDRVYVLEPSHENGAVKVGRKGVGEFEVRFLGRSAHAGNHPHIGASALREMAHFLFFAESLNDAEKKTTVNATVGRGGSAVNVIPEEAMIRLDFRVLELADAERVEDAVRGYAPKDPRVQVFVEGGLNRPPLEPTAENLKLFAQIEKVGFQVASAVVGGGSDGNFTSALGVPTLDGMGAVGDGSHARHEHLRVAETLERVALLATLLATP